MPANDQQIDSCLSRLGLAKAPPLVRRNLQAALEFFQQFMPALGERDQENFLRGMDLHESRLGVSIEWLKEGEVVAAFRRPGESPFRLFYTRAGTGMQDLGINPADRGFKRFRVKHAVQALASRASGARDTWTLPGSRYLAGGGGRQYIIPNAETHLELV